MKSRIALIGAIRMLERDEKGQFVESADSLFQKTIGLRISKNRYPKLEILAQKTGKSVAQLAREAVHQYIDEIDSENPDLLKP